MGCIGLFVFSFVVLSVCMSVCKHNFSNSTKLRMQSSNLNGHLYSMKIINSPACSCGFVNEK